MKDLPLKRSFPYWMLLLLPLILAGCEKEAPVAPPPGEPKIFFYDLPDTLWAGSTQVAQIVVGVDDPRAPSFARSVQIKLTDATGQTLVSAPMRDDGHGGDVLAKDGIFVYGFVPATLQPQGDWLEATCSLVDSGGTAAASVTGRISLLPGNPGVPPEIIRLEQPDSLFTVADSSFEVTVQARDPDGDLQQIQLAIFEATSLTPLKTLESAVSGDSAAAEFTISTSWFRPNRMDYFFRAVATDSAGNSSQPVASRLHFERYFENDPPQVLEIMAPDTLSRSQQNTFLLEARVYDPQGLDDIAKVVLNTYLPSGEITSNSPFLLRDDGFGGDRVPGDGIYSQTFQVPSNTPVGTYRFDVYAEDRSGLKSSVKSHYLTVVE